jgi:hypothetical protein
VSHTFPHTMATDESVLKSLEIETAMLHLICEKILGRQMKLRSMLLASQRDRGQSFCGCSRDNAYKEQNQKLHMLGTDKLIIPLNPGFYSKHAWRPQMETIALRVTLKRRAEFVEHECPLTTFQGTASIAGGLAFLRCGGASPPAATRSRKTTCRSSQN